MLLLLLAAAMALIAVMQIRAHALESTVFEVAQSRRILVKSVRMVRVPCKKGACSVMRIRAFLDDEKAQKEENTIAKQVDFLAGNAVVTSTDLQKVIFPGKTLVVPVVKNKKGFYEVVSLYFGEQSFPFVMVIFSLWYVFFWCVLAVFSRRGLERFFPVFLES